MKNALKTITFLVICTLLFSRCDNQADDYYAEPDWLEPPLYQVLEEEGRFSLYLACLDRTLYAPQIKEGGYFTLMAPNDDAFKAYLAENNYASVNDIPLEIANKIVAYSIVKSYWLSENLGDVFQGTVGDRYVTGEGVKKQTYYYETIYQDPDYDNKWVIDQNARSTTYSTTADANFKYLPVFMPNYFSKGQLTANDYNTFFPNSEYVGNQSTANKVIGNVYDGAIVMPNMKARNGIAHEVSTVNYPLGNMDKFLQGEQYSVFKSLLDFQDLSGTYLYKHYGEDAALTTKYTSLYPDYGIDNVYVKSYSTDYLAFSPALERIYQETTEVTESNGNTLFVPNNEVLAEYIQSRLLKYYPSLDQLPTDAITNLINAHMTTSMIWPSQFKSSQVSSGEYINGLGYSGESFEEFGISDKQLASNGFIYTIDRVIKSRQLETVYAEIFLNPAYSLLNIGLNNYFSTSYKEELMKSVISGYPDDRYTLLLLSNDLLREDGFGYTELTNAFDHSLAVGTTSGVRLQRLILSHIFPGWVDGHVDSEVDFTQATTTYGGWGFRNTAYGDVIRYKDNQIQASGNIEDNTYVNITKGETFDNGTVYTIDKMLLYAPRETHPTISQGWTDNTLWYYLQQTAQENTNVSQFVEYIRHSIKSTDSDALTGISQENFYTIIMPNNNAINNAVKNNDLPNLDSLANSLLESDRVELAAAFVKSHFLAGVAFPDDGLDYLYPYNVNSPSENLVTTMYKITDESLRLINQSTSIRVTKEADGSIKFTPQDVMKDGKLMITGIYGMTGTPRLITGKLSRGNNGYRSNRIVGKSIHHEYNNYFKFTVQSNP